MNEKLCIAQGSILDLDHLNMHFDSQHYIKTMFLNKWDHTIFQLMLMSLWIDHNSHKWEKDKKRNEFHFTYSSSSWWDIIEIKREMIDCLANMQFIAFLTFAQKRRRFVLFHRKKWIFPLQFKVATFHYYI